MRKMILLSLMPLFLSASLLDFRVLEEAKKSYDEGNYTRAIEQYGQLEQKSDEILYDEANSYYRLKKYKEALELYSSLSKPELMFKRWHNSGNCYAHLGKLDEGIEAYEKALKIRDDKETRFNLELLKKKKKEQEKKKQQKKNDKNNKKNDKNQKDKKKNQDNKKDSKNQDKKNSENKDKKDSKEDKKKSQEQKKREEEKRKKEEQKRKEEQEKKDAESKKNQESMHSPIKKEPISDKELKKYQKMLDQRGISTLLVPLETKEGDKNDEINPW